MPPSRKPKKATKPRSAQAGSKQPDEGGAAGAEDTKSQPGGEMHKEVDSRRPEHSDHDSDGGDNPGSATKTNIPSVTDDLSWLTFGGLVRMAVKLVPAFKWAIGAAGLYGLAGSIIKWGLNIGTLSLVAGILLVGALSFIVLQWISKLDKRKASAMAAFMGWSLLLLLVASLVSIFTSSVSNTPWPFKTWISNLVSQKEDSTLVVPDPKRETRIAAQEILAKISSVSVPRDSSQRQAHRNAIAILRSIGDLDVDLYVRTTMSDPKVPKPSPKDVQVNREKRAQALDQFRSMAKSVIADWQLVVDAVSLTEAKRNVIEATPGLAIYAKDLRELLPSLIRLRSDLNQAIAIGTGKEDAAPPDSKTNVPATGHVARRIDTGLNEAFDRLKSLWEHVADACNPLTTVTETGIPKRMDPSQIVSVSIGFSLIILLLGLVFWRRNLTTAEYTFARIILALAVACIAVLLTGFLNVEFKGVIQAGGAFAVFVIVYKLSPAALQGSSNWQDIRSLWRDRRDLHDDPAAVNQDDVASTLNAINETAQMISDDDSLFRPFKQDYADDFCRLYRKLVNNKYTVESGRSTSDLALRGSARRLASRIDCPG